MELFVEEIAKQQLVDIMNTNPKEKIFVVYGHKSKTTNKWFVGQTALIPDIAKRFEKTGWMYVRKEDTPEGRKFKYPDFSEAILKYGWEDFENYILGYYTKDKIDEGEEFWIENKNALKGGYNLVINGKESIKLEFEREQVSNPVVAYDPETLNVIEIFTSMNQAAKTLGIKQRSGISDCCRGKAKTCNGYAFKYLSGESKRYSWDREERVKAIESGKRIAVKVVKFDLDGRALKIYNSSEEAGIAEGIRPSEISRCCRHERRTSHGYKWEFIREEN